MASHLLPSFLKVSDDLDLPTPDLLAFKPHYSTLVIVLLIKQH